MGHDPPNLDIGRESTSATPSNGSVEMNPKDEYLGSRRPTFVAPEITAVDSKTEDITLAEGVAPKWTAKRVIQVSWNYVTTAKVNYTKLFTDMAGVSYNDLHVECYCLGRNVVSSPGKRSTGNVLPNLRRYQLSTSSLYIPRML